MEKDGRGAQEPVIMKRNHKRLPAFLYGIQHRCRPGKMQIMYVNDIGIKTFNLLPCFMVGLEVKR
jgi:hypothetical protein